MGVTWTSEEVGLHRAECHLGAGAVVHLLVESLGEHGWDWQVWNPAGHCRTHYGLADTLRAAKVRAELALVAELTSRGKRASLRPGRSWRLHSRCSVDARRRGRVRVGRDAALLLAGAGSGASDAYQRSGQGTGRVTLCEG